MTSDRIGTILLRIVFTFLYFQNFSLAQEAPVNLHYLADDFPDIDIRTMSIHEDSRGFIWMGGYINIHRFDGIRLNTYRKSDIWVESENFQWAEGSVFLNDSNRNLWMATGGALCFYDSISDHFTRVFFDTTAVQVQSDYMFLFLLEDSAHNLWLSTDGGFLIRIPINELVNRIQSSGFALKIFVNNIDFEIIQLDPGNADREQKPRIEKIFEDSKKNIWIQATNGQYDIQVSRFYPGENGKPGNFVTFLGVNGSLPALGCFSDIKKRIWLHTGGRLIKVDLTENILKTHYDSVVWDVPKRGIYTVFYYYPFLKNSPGSTETDVVISKLFSTPAYQTLEQCVPDKDGFWTRNWGLIHYKLPESDTDSDVLTYSFYSNNFGKDGMRGWEYVAFKSREDLLWFGPHWYRAFGTSLIDLKSFNQFTKFDQQSPDYHLAAQEFYGMYVDYKDNIWIKPHNSGLIYLLDKNFNLLDKIEIASDWIDYGMIYGNGKYLLVNGLSNGKTIPFIINIEMYYRKTPASRYITKLKPENFGLPVSHQLNFSLWYGAYVDKKNRFWLAEKTGLFYLDPDNLKLKAGMELEPIRFAKLQMRTEPEDSLLFTGMEPDLSQGKNIEFIYTDEDNLFIHNKNYIIEIDDENRHYWKYNLADATLKNYLSEGLLLSHCMDRFGNIWLVSEKKTHRVTLENKKIKSIATFTDKQGFPPSPFSVIPDHKGNIWLYDDSEGLFSYNDETGKIRRYSGAGIIKGYRTVANYRDGKNNLYFSAGDGITKFHPDSIRDNPFIPPVRITDIKIIHESIYRSGDSTLFSALRSGNELVVPYNRNILTIEFAALSYTAPLRNLYAYQLSGVDRDWVYADAKHAQATYSSLAPGSYTFRVKGSNNDGIWNETGTSLDITILPPWWLTAWMKIVYVLLSGATVWGLIYIRTLRQKRKLEEVERINAKLRQIDQLKDQFLSNTSHELRTPLLGIIGIAESLLEGIAGPITPKLKENLRIIIGSGKRLSNLINDILDFSKLRSHELALQLQPVDMFSATDVVVSLLRPFIKRKELLLINNIPRDLPLVEADENRIQQILFNLLGNAIKFTEKGSVTLSGSLVNGSLAITVSDSGIGIPEDKLDVIFRPFEQAEGSITRDYGGTGIGLSITRQLVELHGGTIRVQSVVGQGSHFTFTLPLSRISRKEFEAALPVHETLSGIVVEEAADEIHAPAVRHRTTSTYTEIPVRILVVDDEPVNLQVLQNYLNLEGYRVTLANSGFEALTCLEKEEKYDLIILDIMMPKLSGFEVCKKIREIYMSTELPVVIVTAKNRVTDLVEGFSVGANDYLTKPFSREELLSRIRTHLNLHRINKATGRFVPYEFLRSIGRESIIDTQVGDQAHKVVSVLFLDIREYASLSESMSPEDNFRFINSLVGKIGPAIRDNNGFVNQYIGDAVMAIFPQKADHSLKGAIRIQQIISEYNLYRISRKRKPIQIGVGIHTGHLIMGIIGDENRAETATIADTVNIASRIEGLTRHYGVRILITEECIQHLEVHADYHFRVMGEVIVKGKQYPTKIFECFNGDEPEVIDLKLQTLDEFDEGLRCFYAREFPEASVVFNKIVKKNSQDFAAAYFYRRAIQFAMTGVPDDWTGVEKLETK